MALDPRYIPLFNLQQEFVDKQTALPLAGGVVYSWHDNNRNDPKPLYQLSGAPPNYTYTALPNPVTLTNAGTFSDGSGNDIVAYAFPYNANGDPDNYYIQVFAEPSVPPFPPVGTPILTREAVPGVTQESGPLEVGPSSLANQLVNSQFVDVLFDPSIVMTITYIAGTTDVQIAPGWGMRITASSGGNLTIERVSVAGSSNFDTNPPYYLEITPGANITNLILYQTLDHNPNIFAEQLVSAGMALGPNSPVATIYYAPQGNIFGPALHSAGGASNWDFRSSTTLINPGQNANTADAGYVEIQIKLASNGTTKISSLQIISMDPDEENANNLPYNQVSVNQQKNETFYYYDPQLKYKPIPSYLVGWDFPLNPAQFLGDTVAAQAIGANKSYYAWDQTIIFQEQDSGVSVSRETSGAIKLTAATTGQFAMLQYLDEKQARELLAGRMSVFVSGYTNAADGYNGKVTLWATADATLPDLKNPNYLSGVSSLDATGKPTMGNGTWVEVTRDSLGDAVIALTSTSTDFRFSGWTVDGAAIATTAKYFCIVVGFEEITNTDSVSFNSIAVNAGDIATRPAPKTSAETILACQEFYWKTFATGTVPAGSITAGQIIWQAIASTVGFYNSNMINFPVPMRKQPTITIYSPANGSNSIRNSTVGFDCISVVSSDTAAKTLFAAADMNGAGALGNALTAQFTADARLGIKL